MAQISPYLESVIKLTKSVLSKTDQKVLFMQYKTTKDEKQQKILKDKLFSHNLKLVLRVFNQRKHKVSDPDELLMVLVLELLRCIDRYDVTIYQFSTYALKCLNWASSDYSRRETKIPVSLEDRVSRGKINKEKIYAYSIHTSHTKSHELLVNAEPQLQVEFKEDLEIKEARKKLMDIAKKAKVPVEELNYLIEAIEYPDKKKSILLQNKSLSLGKHKEYLRSRLFRALNKLKKQAQQEKPE